MLITALPFRTQFQAKNPDTTWPIIKCPKFSHFDDRSEALAADTPETNKTASKSIFDKKRKCENVTSDFGTYFRRKPAYKWSFLLSKTAILFFAEFEVEDLCILMSR